MRRLNDYIQEWIDAGHSMPAEPDDYVASYPKESAADYEYLCDFAFVFAMHLMPGNGGGGNHIYLSTDDIIGKCTKYVAAWKDNVLVYIAIYIDDVCVSMGVIRPDISRTHYSFGINAMLWTLVLDKDSYRNWIIGDISEDVTDVPINFNGFLWPDRLNDDPDRPLYTFASNKDYISIVDDVCLINKI